MLKSARPWPDVSEIRRKRKELGITQQQLAVTSKVTQPVISRIEDGSISEPSYGVVKMIFAALDDFEAQRRGVSGKRDRPVVASDLMNEQVIHVKPTDRVKDAWEIMKKKNYSQLPVIDESHRVVGGLSERSFTLADMESILDKRVSEVMGDAFPTVGKGTGVPTLVSLLKTEPAILVSEKGKLVGIITAYDLIENAYRKNPGVVK